MLQAGSGESIVHVVASIRHGGAERVVLDLARRQQSDGAQVGVVCLHFLGDLQPAFDEAKIPVTLLEGAERPGVLRTAWRLGGWLQQARPAVVHTHNGAPQIAAGLAQRLRHWRGPDNVLVHTEHGRLHDLRPALLQLRRWTASEFDAVIAVSDDARAQLLRHGIRGTHGVDVVLNGVDLTRFPPRTAQRAGNGAHIVNVGRLDVIKGQDVLLEAMVLVHHALPNARLTMVGDGPARTQLRQQAQELGVGEIVEFVGAVADVRQYLDRADLFVLPSRSEGISLALLEAMAVGLPVVATDVGGTREVVGSDKCGILVPADESQPLAEAIVTLLDHPAVAAAKGLAARQEVERRFNFDRTVRSYARYYEGQAGRDHLGSAA